jgi:hypothetical protein
VETVKEAWKIFNKLLTEAKELGISQGEVIEYLYHLQGIMGKVKPG